MTNSPPLASIEALRYSGYHFPADVLQASGFHYGALSVAGFHDSCGQSPHAYINDVQIEIDEDGRLI